MATSSSSTGLRAVAQVGFSSVVGAFALLICLGTAIAQKNMPSSPLDLNTATVVQLEKLPGIGPSTAKSIIAFRERSGPIQRVEDLLAIKGISKARLEKLRPYITVAPAPSGHK